MAMIKKWRLVKSHGRVYAQCTYGNQPFPRFGFPTRDDPAPHYKWVEDVGKYVRNISCDAILSN